MKLNRTHFLYLFIFIIPWQARWIARPFFLNWQFFEYATLSVYASEIILWIFLISSLTKFKEIKLKDADIFLISFWILSFILAFFALSQSLAFFALFRLTEGILLYFAVRTARLKWDRLLWVLAVSGLLEAVYAILQVYMQKIYASTLLGVASKDPLQIGSAVVENEFGGRLLRAYGSLPHPNILGGFLLLSLTAVIVLYLKKYFAKPCPKKAKLAALCVAFIIVFSGLLLTFSRAACIGFVIILVVFGAVFLARKKTRPVLIPFSQIVILSIVIFGVFFFIFQDQFLTRAGAKGRLEHQSIDMRAEQIEDARSIISSEWLTGAGLGNYTLRTAADKKFYLSAFTQPAHNGYILVFAETGLMGVLIWVYFLGLVIFDAVRAVRLKARIKYLFCAAILAALLFINIFDHYLWTLYPGIIMWWLVFGLVAREKNIAKV